jgi:hypothetical protein
MTVTLLPANRAIKLLVYQNHSGQLVLNRFNYLASVEPSNTELLSFVNEFATSVWSAVRAIQSQAVLTFRITAEVLGGNLALADLPLNVSGAHPVEALPPEAAFSFRFARVNAGVRGGFKRISGVPEDRQASGVLLQSFLNQPVVAQCRAALVSPLTVSSIDYVPIIIITTYNAQPLPEPYYWQPTAVSLRNTVGTQNTRRRGQGA